MEFALHLVTHKSVFPKIFLLSPYLKYTGIFDIIHMNDLKIHCRLRDIQIDRHNAADENCIHTFVYLHITLGMGFYESQIEATRMSFFLTKCLLHSYIHVSPQLSNRCCLLMHTRRIVKKGQQQNKSLYDNIFLCVREVMM